MRARRTTNIAPLRGWARAQSRTWRWALVFFHLPILLIAQAPPAFLWARQAGGGTNDEALAVAVDPAGNVLVTGFFMGAVSFGNTNLVSSGAEDIFVAKYDPAGNLLWVRQAGGTGYDEGRGIASDQAGNIYVTGLFQATASFGSSSLTSSGQSDIFIAKYNPSGTLLWAVGAGGKDFDEAHAIAVDAQGNAYITGYFDANASFGSFSLQNNSGSDDIFVAKCDRNGSFLWARKAGGSLDDNGNSIALDAATNVYVAGFFGGTATFGATNLTAAGTSGSPDIFLAKYDAAGNLLWVRQAGGSGDDEANAVAADAAGNVFVAGKFFTSATFGPTNLLGNGMDIFLARYDTTGNFRWAQRAGGNNVIYGDAALGLATDAAGNALVTGYFSGTATFGNTNQTSAGFDDVFCGKYDPGGNLVWVRTAGGPDLDLGYGVAADAFGNAYLAGFFASSTVSFDGVTVTNSGGRDIFLAKLGLPIVPALSVLLTNGQLVLSWPAAAAGYSLQSTTNFASPAWTAVSLLPNLVNQTCVVTLPATAAQAFFRLRKQ